MKPDDTKLPLAKPEIPAKPHPKRLRIAIGVVAGLVIIAIVILLFMILTKSTSPQARQENAFTVGNNAFVYPCSTFTRDDIATSFNLQQAKDNVYITANDARRTSSEKIDILSLPSPRPSYLSDCRYNFTITGLSQAGPQAENTITTLVMQYSDNQAAKKALEEIKTTQPTAQPLPSFSNNGHFNSSTIEDVFTASGFIVVNNLVLVVHANLKNTDETANKGFLDSALQKATARLQQKVAYQASDLSGSRSIGNQKFSDVCALVDGQKLSQNLQTVQLKGTSVSTIANLAEFTANDKTPKNLQSTCLFYFRTIADAEAQTSLDKNVGYDERFMHSIMIDKRQFATTDEAKSALQSSKQALQESSENGKRPSVEPIAFGDQAFKIITTFQNGADTSYYIQKDTSIYHLLLSSFTQSKTQRGQTLESKGYDIKDDVIKRVFEQVVKETKV